MGGIIVQEDDTMTRSYRVALGIAVALTVGAFTTQTAEAGGRRYWGGYGGCAPVYCAPVVRPYCPPVYAAPVVYRPVVTYAAPVVYAPPVVTYPAPVYYGAPVYRAGYVAPYRARGFSLAVGW